MHLLTRSRQACAKITSDGARTHHRNLHGRLPLFHANRSAERVQAKLQTATYASFLLKAIEASLSMKSNSRCRKITTSAEKPANVIEIVASV
jgi:hypothetical protein